MKRILVTQRIIRNETYPEERDALDVRWGGFLRSAGLLPLLVPSGIPVGEFLEGLSFDGLLLTGGNDLGHLGGDELSCRRDELEFELLRRVSGMGLPILGVCRGQQVIAHAHGLPVAPLAGHVGVRHRIEVDRRSRWLGHLAGVEVNSYHSAGVGGAIAGFLPGARASDGSIESIEHETASLLGIMWHPEREVYARPQELGLFRRFFGTEAQP